MNDLEQNIRKLAESGQFLCTLNGTIDLLAVADRLAFLERQSAGVLRKLQSAQVAQQRLREALEEAQAHLDWIGWGDTYERECATEQGLPDKVQQALDLAKETRP